ncbi:helicase-related protein [Vibrio sp. V39_P1S14PM300]|uniref:helicase-related protein n=1 Tax=Vibrio sp. V39_P1S14PM300 TaxID=1938690 RepID=UPI001372AC37|nr:helicase-related protein [Vibrio sp. V39_P1S14PM300]NAX19732.1 DEAD/DEAH box helicase [Vibrio sp. V39_P1S14PM300]
MHSLPIDVLAPQVQSLLSRHHLVVEAETGSGKSTRLPLWAAEQGKVLVVEPRRIACTSLAQFLALQRDERLGQSVGYAIKLENRFTPDTQVVFVTPGVALRWFAEDKLAQFDVVMVDEYHERRWDTDVLVAMLKAHQHHRLIITSATLEGERLARYVGAQRLQAQGRQFQVEMCYRAKESRQLPDSRGLESRVRQEIEQLIASDIQGDVLVFLPGRKEIALCQSALTALHDWLVVPLHASVSDKERELALNPQSQRKVVLATNVAETSLTIPNIVAVIDSGLERRTVQRNGRTTLTLTHISKASARQRSGRAGRVMDGICIRLYGEHAALENVTPPELQREALTEPMLTSATCGYCLTELDLLDQLSEKSLDAAHALLRNMEALDDKGRVTEHGRTLYPLPIDALYADLVTRMPSKALKEAMIDLTAALSVPAALYSYRPDSDALELLNQEEPHHCDAEINIKLVRGVVLPGVRTEPDALAEARGLAEQMREVFALPMLEVASRYDRAALCEAIAGLHPELLFVRRERRREALGNGHLEVMPARHTRFHEAAEAALVLDTHSLPGRGVKQTLNLATVMLPVPLALLERLELGEWQQGETVYDGEKALSNLELVFAGRIVATRQVAAQGSLAVKPIVEAVMAEELMPGFARHREAEITHWKIYAQLGMTPESVSQDLSFESWFSEQLTLLELDSVDDLALFNESDFPFAGVPDWEYADFAETYPLALNLGDLNLSVEYYPAKKLVHVVYQSGLRKGDPKRWELPRWQGWRLQYKKASRIVDVK